MSAGSMRCSTAPSQCPARQTCAAASPSGSARRRWPRCRAPPELLVLEVQAGLRAVDDARTERLDPGPARTLAFDVALAAEHQQRLDAFVKVAWRNVERAGVRAVVEDDAGGVAARHAVGAQRRRLLVGRITQPGQCRQTILGGEQRGHGIVAALLVHLRHRTDVVPADVIVWHAIEQRVTLCGLVTTRRRTVGAV